MVEEKKKTEKKVEGKTPKKEKDIEMNAEIEKKYSIRGNVFEGVVTSAKATKTVTVERILTQYIPKYERYKKIKSKIKAHNPTSINAQEGDVVRVGETRKISKTKNFVVVKIIKKEVKK